MISYCVTDGWRDQTPRPASAFEDTAEMNETERDVLKRHHMDMVRDIIVTEELLGECYQNKLFDTYFIDAIRSQPSQALQISKLLEYLPKRGPDAFSLFVKIIEPAYPWICKKLMSSIEQLTCNKIHKSDQSECLTSRSTTTTQTDQLNNNDHTVTGYRPQSIRVNEPASNFDPQIKSQVEQFVHRQFCMSRKMSETDKRAVENFLCKQMQKLLQHQSALEMDNATIKQWLLDMNNKLKAHVEDQEKEINKNQDGTESTHTEETINMKTLERQINLLLNKLNKLETQVTWCYELFDDKNRKTLLKNHIEELLEKCKILCCEVKNQKKNEDNMSEEIYNLTMNQKTLEQKQQLKDIELEVKCKQITSLQQNIKDFKSEIERLNEINWQHIEKEKTLDSLKQIIGELQESHEKIKEENELLRLKLETYEKASTKNSPRRAGTSSRINNTRLYKCSQKSPRKKSQS